MSDDDTLAVALPADTLSEYLDIVGAIDAVNECRLRFGRNGLDTCVVDPANVFMTNAHLGTEAFTTVGSGMFVAGVNIEMLQNHLSFARDDADDARLTYDEEVQKLNIQIGGHYQAHMALIDPDSIRQEPDIPDLEDDLVNDFTAPLAALKEGIRATDIVSDHLRIVGDTDAEEVAVVADGDTDETRYTFTGDELQSANVTGDAETLLSNGYLKKMRSGIPNGLDVRVRFGDEFPVKFEYEYADGAGEALHMQAPRIESQ